MGPTGGGNFDLPQENIRTDEHEINGPDRPFLDESVVHLSKPGDFR